MEWRVTCTCWCAFHLKYVINAYVSPIIHTNLGMSSLVPGDGPIALSFQELYYIG